MSGRAVRMMIDANVWVDNYCGWHSESSACRDMFAVACRSGDIELYYPVHIIKDVQYMVGLEYKQQARIHEGALTESAALAAKKAALACMRNMNELACAVGADGSDVWLADKYLSIHPDFEDNLVLAACKRIKADYLVTNDRALIRNADVLAKTPAQMLELLDLGKLQTFDDFSPDEISWKFRS